MEVLRFSLKRVIGSGTSLTQLVSVKHLLKLSVLMHVQFTPTSWVNTVTLSLLFGHTLTLPVLSGTMVAAMLT